MVTILVDAPRWHWRGTSWAHLVSDASHAELHEFARRLGKRRAGFQGDHYDVDLVDHARALDRGAVAVDSRELVRRLRHAGLRDRTAKPRWHELARRAPDEPVDVVTEMLRAHAAPGRRLATALDAYEDLAAEATTLVLGDAGRLAALVELAPGRLAVHRRVDVDLHVVGGPRADATSTIELFVRR